MDAEFNRELERIRGGEVEEVLDLRNGNIGDDGARALSTALIHENNKVITLNLSLYNVGDEGVKYLSTALMNKNNKLITLNLPYNNIGDDGARVYLWR